MHSIRLTAFKRAVNRYLKPDADTTARTNGDAPPVDDEITSLRSENAKIANGIAWRIASAGIQSDKGAAARLVYAEANRRDGLGYVADLGRQPEPYRKRRDTLRRMQVEEWLPKVWA